MSLQIHFQNFVRYCPRNVKYAGQRPAYQTATHTEWYMPGDVLIQLILLMMSTGFLEIC